MCMCMCGVCCNAHSLKGRRREAETTAMFVHFRNDASKTVQGHKTAMTSSRARYNIARSLRDVLPAQRPTCAAASVLSRHIAEVIGRSMMCVHNWLHIPAATLTSLALRFNCFIRSRADVMIIATTSVCCWQSESKYNS